MFAIHAVLMKFSPQSYRNQIHVTQGNPSSEKEGGGFRGDMIIITDIYLSHDVEGWINGFSLKIQ